MNEEMIHSRRQFRKSTLLLPDMGTRYAMREFNPESRVATRPRIRELHSESKSHRTRITKYEPRTRAAIPARSRVIP